MSTRDQHAQARMSRRRFLKTASLFAFPAIVPASVFGANAPSNRVNVGCIGVGRKGLGDMRHAADLKKKTRVLAVCDVDANRAAFAKRQIDRFYKDKGCTAYGDFRDLLARGDIDAVILATPDHWHASPAIAAAKAGKALFVQKPLSLTIEEGRAIADAAAQNGTVFQVGSQQRSDPRFQWACKTVLEGKIGRIEHIEVGIGIDPGGSDEPVMPVPENLDYDFWLGQAPQAEYTEKRVHPQKGYGRPGWLRIRDYGAGMITGWGAHHIDVAHWGMGLETSGPIEVEGSGKFPESGLWNVHGDFDLTYRYANGVVMRVAANSRLQQGVRFQGSEGAVFVSRGALEAEPRSLLASQKKLAKTRMSDIEDFQHMENFVDGIRESKATAAPAEVAHRSCSACLIGAIVMELGRKVQWDPEKESFGDAEANAKRSRAMRAPWQL